MPRPNAPRTMTYESNLARRIEHERERRDWTYERLAQRMTEAGCAIHSSAIFKIVKGQPPRKITVDEFMAFAEVFDLEPDDLLLPPELALTEELRTLVREHYEAVKAWRPYWRRVLATKQALADRVRDDKPAQAALKPILQEALGVKIGTLMDGELRHTRARES